MNASTLTIEELGLLPEEIKRQLVDYAEFLLHKYANEHNDLDPAIKSLLKDRKEYYESNELLTFEASEIENQLTKKYGGDS